MTSFEDNRSAAPSPGDGPADDNRGPVDAREAIDACAVALDQIDTTLSLIGSELARIRSTVSDLADPERDPRAHLAPYLQELAKGIRRIEDRLEEEPRPQGIPAVTPPDLAEQVAAALRETMETGTDRLAAPDLAQEVAAALDERGGFDRVAPADLAEAVAGVLREKMEAILSDLLAVTSAELNERHEEARLEREEVSRVLSEVADALAERPLGEAPEVSGLAGLANGIAAIAGDVGEVRRRIDALESRITDVAGGVQIAPVPPGESVAALAAALEATVAEELTQTRTELTDLETALGAQFGTGMMSLMTEQKALSESVQRLSEELVTLKRRFPLRGRREEVSLSPESIDELARIVRERSASPTAVDSEHPKSRGLRRKRPADGS